MKSTIFDCCCCCQQLLPFFFLPFSFVTPRAHFFLFFFAYVYIMIHFIFSRFLEFSSRQCFLFLFQVITSPSPSLIFSSLISYIFSRFFFFVIYLFLAFSFRFCFAFAALFKNVKITVKYIITWLFSFPYSHHFFFFPLFFSLPLNHSRCHFL